MLTWYEKRVRSIDLLDEMGPASLSLLRTGGEGTSVTSAFQVTVSTPSSFFLTPLKTLL